MSLDRKNNHAHSKVKTKDKEKLKRLNPFKSLIYIEDSIVNSLKN